MFYANDLSSPTNFNESEEEKNIMAEQQTKQHFATLALHGGQTVEQTTKARAVPI